MNCVPGHSRIPARALFAASIALIVFAPLRSLAEYPSVDLHNPVIRMKIYLPDTSYGYYRSCRFDWSGMIASLTYEGHTVYGEWQTPHYPQKPDHGIGPCEEFGMENPPGYESAAPGETFCKIGVGALVKESYESYQFNDTFDILDHGRWHIQADSSTLETTHELSLTSGYGYTYTKTIVVASDAPSFTIQHLLTNTGSISINTNHYNHNFTIIDDEHIGSSYRVTFPFSIQPLSSIQQSFHSYASVSGDTIALMRSLTGGKTLWAQFEDVPGGSASNGFSVTNTESGIRIYCTGDAPVALYRFWAHEMAICPEPYISIDLDPGESMNWSATYTIGSVEQNIRYFPRISCERSWDVTQSHSTYNLLGRISAHESNFRFPSGVTLYARTAQQNQDHPIRVVEVQH